jgi:hypothetical protein
MAVLARRALSLVVVLLFLARSISMDSQHQLEQYAQVERNVWIQDKDVAFCTPIMNAQTCGIVKQMNAHASAFD